MDCKKLGKTIATIVLGIILVFVLAVSSKPDEFSISRSATIPASSGVVFAKVNNLHRWQSWSPWAELDPNAKTTFEGPKSGKGAIMRWDGNGNVGAGSMTIVESHPNSSIKFQLDFLKPFKGTNQAEFKFEHVKGGTLVTWTMSGHNNFIGKAMSMIMNCDKMVGEQFEKGLANLSREAKNS